jgi:hypothetical protein
MLLFKPGAQGFVMKHEVVIVNDNGLDPYVGFSDVGFVGSHPGS